MGSYVWLTKDVICDSSPSRIENSESSDDSSDQTSYLWLAYNNRTFIEAPRTSRKV